MKSHFALLMCVLSVTLGAQQPVPKAPPVPPAAPAPPAPPAPAVDPEQGGQPINIRLDVSVIDQNAQGGTQPKSLMVMLVDRAMGRTRAAFEDRSVAVDARPTMVEGRIRVNLTIQSDAARSFGPPQEQDQTLNWRNSFSLLLENGKPLLALETNDAATKRKMSIEVKATIQK
jgi:hypothetical protein